MAKYEVIS